MKALREKTMILFIFASYIKNNYACSQPPTTLQKNEVCGTRIMGYPTLGCPPVGQV